MRQLREAQIAKTQLAEQVSELTGQLTEAGKASREKDQKIIDLTAERDVLKQRLADAETSKPVANMTPMPDAKP